MTWPFQRGGLLSAWPLKRGPPIYHGIHSKHVTCLLNEIYFLFLGTSTSIPEDELKQRIHDVCSQFTFARY